MYSPGPVIPLAFENHGLATPYPYPSSSDLPATAYRRTGNGYESCVILRGKDPIIDGLIFGVEIALVLYVI